MRWVGDPEQLKSAIGIIEQNTKRPWITSMAPYEQVGVAHDWFSWDPVMRLTPQMIQNACDQHLNLRDLLLENTISNILLCVKMTFSDFNMDKLGTNLMILKYDKFNHVMFWEDGNGG